MQQIPFKILIFFCWAVILFSGSVESFLTNLNRQATSFVTSTSTVTVTKTEKVHRHFYFMIFNLINLFFKILMIIDNLR